MFVQDCHLWELELEDHFETTYGTPILAIKKQPKSFMGCFLINIRLFKNKTNSLSSLNN